jgi:predicted transposase/invertase (TIGR01784 family)
MHEQDHSYKLLFSHAEMVADLLRGFVHEAWVEHLDWTTLEKVNQSFISDDLREREDDVIWRVRLANEWVYIYLLLEFQSTVDPFMAVRILTYVGLLYQDLIKQQSLTTHELLPPVFPLVLYNGRSRWQAARNIRDLIQPVPGGLEKYRPQLEYLLVDEGRFSEIELIPLHNLVAALFQLEQSRTAQDIQKVLTHLLEWLQTPEQNSLRRDFTTWLRRVILPRRLPHVQLPEMNDLQEMRNMLAETVQQWYADAEAQGLQQGFQQGMQQGMQQGIQTGQLKGEQSLFHYQLQTKFGQLPREVEEQISTLNTEALRRCAKRLLTAVTLEEVFQELD